MNSLDIYNYGSSLLVILGASVASASIIRYQDKIIDLVSKNTMKDTASGRLTIEGNPAEKYTSPMILEA